jgi:hypothetical protein
MDNVNETGLPQSEIVRLWGECGAGQFLDFARAIEKAVRAALSQPSARPANIEYKFGEVALIANGGASVDNVLISQANAHPVRAVHVQKLARSFLNDDEVARMKYETEFDAGDGFASTQLAYRYAERGGLEFDSVGLANLLEDFANAAIAASKSGGVQS